MAEKLQRHDPTQERSLHSNPISTRYKAWLNGLAGLTELKRVLEYVLTKLEYNNCPSDASVCASSEGGGTGCPCNVFGDRGYRARRGLLSYVRALSAAA